MAWAVNERATDSIDLTPPINRNHHTQHTLSQVEAPPSIRLSLRVAVRVCGVWSRRRLASSRQTRRQQRSHHTMVCETCESKLSKLVVPDKWKAGARNVIGGKDGGARVQSAGPSSINKIAEKRKARLAEAGGGISARLCRICKVKIDPQRHYCNDCAYKKGICSMCGRKQIDTSKYKMSTK